MYFWSLRDAMERKSTRAGFNGVETADTPARCRVQELSMAAFYVRRTFMRVLIRRLSRQIVFLVPARLPHPFDSAANTIKRHPANLCQRWLRALLILNRLLASSQPVCDDPRRPHRGQIVRVASPDVMSVGKSKDHRH